jgi:hypothetical protein
MLEFFFSVNEGNTVVYKGCTTVAPVNGDVNNEVTSSNVVRSSNVVNKAITSSDVAKNVVKNVVTSSDVANKVVTSSNVAISNVTSSNIGKVNPNDLKFHQLIMTGCIDVFVGQV